VDLIAADLIACAAPVATTGSVYIHIRSRWPLGCSAGFWLCCCSCSSFDRQGLLRVGSQKISMCEVGTLQVQIGCRLG